jgi:hypothetical protein
MTNAELADRLAKSMDDSCIAYGELGRLMCGHRDTILAALRAQPAPQVPREHYSDCATNNEPAYPNGPCDCKQAPRKPTDAMYEAAIAYLYGKGTSWCINDLWRAMYDAAPAPQPAPPEDAMRVALEELVACKDLKDSVRLVHVGTGMEALPDDQTYDRVMREYKRRQPLAWKAARAALAQRKDKQ